MSTVHLFYICPVCFNACEDLEECHEHLMIRCEPGASNHERRKPVMDATGRIQTRAPRWFLEAVGWIPPEPSSGGTS
jgi:hypothetical protein